MSELMRVAKIGHDETQYGRLDPNSEHGKLVKNAFKSLVDIYLKVHNINYPNFTPTEIWVDDIDQVVAITDRDCTEVNWIEIPFSILNDLKPDKTYLKHLIGINIDMLEDQVKQFEAQINEYSNKKSKVLNEIAKLQLQKCIGVALD